MGSLELVLGLKSCFEISDLNNFEFAAVSNLSGNEFQSLIILDEKKYFPM